MANAFKTLFIILGIFLAVGLRNVSLGQFVGGAFTGTLTGIDTTYGNWVDYQRENTKRGIGKIRPYDGKPYNNNDF